jgi:hypothetical protein
MVAFDSARGGLVIIQFRKFQLMRLLPNGRLKMFASLTRMEKISESVRLNVM